MAAKLKKGDKMLFFQEKIKVRKAK